MANRSFTLRAQDSGAALIVGLILLVIMMVGGIAAMRSTTLNEKITSNQRNKTISLFAAETGVAQFHNWFKATVLATSFSAAKNTWSASPPSQIPRVNNAPLTANAGANSLGYFWVSEVTWNDGNQTVSLTVTGHALSANTSGSVLATSKILVTLKAPGLDLLPSMPAAPLGVASGSVTFSPAAGSQFFINSSSTPAIATGSASSASTITSSITRVDNYTGLNLDGSACANPCVVNSNLGSPWNDPLALKALILELQSKSLAGSPVKFISGDTNNSFSLDNSYPVTVVTGTATINGSTISTSPYTGILIVLGGTLRINGMGNKDISGGIYVANIDLSSATPSFGSLVVDVSGGGTGSISYNPNPANAVGGGNPFQSWTER